MRDPRMCRCTIGTIDYELVDQGELRCDQCGRRWHLDPNRGWQADPPVRPPVARPTRSYPTRSDYPRNR